MKCDTYYMLVTNACWYHNFDPPARVGKGEKMINGLNVEAVDMLDVHRPEGNSTTIKRAIGVEIYRVAMEESASLVNCRLVFCRHVIVKYLRLL